MQFRTNSKHLHHIHRHVDICNAPRPSTMIVVRASFGRSRDRSSTLFWRSRDRSLDIIYVRRSISRPPDRGRGSVPRPPKRCPWPIGHFEWFMIFSSWTRFKINKKIIQKVCRIMWQTLCRIMFHTIIKFEHVASIGIGFGLSIGITIIIL